MSGLTSSPKPIFLVTHPRACSTAFERVFLTRAKDIACVHEPFSDAYHWGPEKLSERYEEVEKWRAKNGFEDYTFRKAIQVIDDARVPGKRVFIKDMGKCLMELDGDEPWIVPSLRPQRTLSNASRRVRRIEHPPRDRLPTLNPTVIPPEVLSGFHYTFLIRHPRRSIPSLYECSTPPKSSVTGWHGFKASDAGYKEMRRLFDYLRRIGQIGPNSGNEICLVDADDLLAYPEEIVEKFCASIGLPFDCGMLRWDTEEDQQRAQDAFKNWAPFHDEVLKSTSLKAELPKVTTPEADMAEWTRKYGREGAALIQKNVEDNMVPYLYLKKFAIKPSSGSCC